MTILTHGSVGKISFTQLWLFIINDTVKDSRISRTRPNMIGNLKKPQENASIQGVW
jgi:hypothetical protein